MSRAKQSPLRTAAGHAARSISSAWYAVQSLVSGWVGAYPSADPRRKILEDWRPRKSSSNQALAPSLGVLCAQLRHLYRMAPTMRGIVEGRKCELVGTGIDVEPTTGDPALNTRIIDEFHAWAAQAGTLGESLWSLQRMASGEIDLAGQFLWVEVIDPAQAAAGRIPFRIQAMEMEDLSELPVEPIAAGNRYVLGVEFDPKNNPVRYHFRDSENPFDQGTVIPAERVQHCFERTRAKMVIGEPRLAALVERTLQDDEIIVSELKTARSTSAMGAFIADDELHAAVNGIDEDAGLPPTEVKPGGIAYVPGDAKVEIVTNTRPSQSVKDFRGTTRGDQAGGAQISRVWIDRDGAAYNFANSKFDQIRTQMVVRPAHDWFGAGAASWPYQRALPWILMRLGVQVPKDPTASRKLFSHKINPDIPPALDERADAEAFKTANIAGINSRTAWLQERGKDPAAINAQRQAEMLNDAQNTIDLIVSIQRRVNEVNAENPGLGVTWDQVVAINGATSAPGAFIQGVALSKSTAATDAPTQDPPNA